MTLVSHMEPEPRSTQHWVAEEAADVVVEAIVERGAKTIERNDLERKAYPFAARSAEEAALSYVSMCYLQAEEQQEEAEFDLEEEPQPEPTDAWARMSIQVKEPERSGHQTSPLLSPNAGRRHRLQGAIFGSKGRGGRGLLDRLAMGGPGGSGQGSARGMEPQATSRPASPQLLRATDFRQVVMMATHSAGGQSWTSASPSSPTSPNTTRLKASQARASPIVDDVKPVCEWEEKLRAEKAKKRQERQAQLARERRLVEEEAIKQAEWQRKIQDEALKGPCTYDNEGNVIWVEELNIEALPKPTYGLNYEVQEDLIVGADEPLYSQGGSRSGSKSRSASKQRLRFALQKEAKKKKKEHAFTDTFHRPVGWQPPLWENFSAKQGVVLECSDGIFRGPPNDSGVGMRMTRRQYETFKQSGKRVPVGCDFASSWQDGTSYSPFASEGGKSELHAPPLHAAPVVHSETQAIDTRFLHPPVHGEHTSSRPGTAPPARNPSRLTTAQGLEALSEGLLAGSAFGSEAIPSEHGASAILREASESTGLPQALGHDLHKPLDATALQFEATGGHLRGDFTNNNATGNNHFNATGNNHLNSTINHISININPAHNGTLDLGGHQTYAANHNSTGRNFVQDAYHSKDSSSDPNGSTSNVSVTLARPATAPGTLRAPAAPGQFQRAKQFGESIGHRPHPRSRAVLLGSTSNVGPAQPPLGACMGHGLMMTTNNKGDFYFPPDQPTPTTPPNMQRAASAGGLGMTKRTTSSSSGLGCATGQRSRPTSRCTNKSSGGGGGGVGRRPSHQSAGVLGVGSHANKLSRPASATVLPARR